MKKYRTSVKLKLTTSKLYTKGPPRSIFSEIIISKVIKKRNMGYSARLMPIKKLEPQEFFFNASRTRVAVTILVKAKKKIVLI